MKQMILLPALDGGMTPHALGPASRFPTQGPAISVRRVYAAAHVVLDPLCPEPVGAPVIDWEATLAFRRHLWGLGFDVAEAMDTSQRGMGIGWETAKTLIKRSLEEARAIEGAGLACGAGTDQLSLGGATLDGVIAAYEEQLAHIESCGGHAILMASRALCRVARSADDYAAVYGRLIAQCRAPVILHWLGPMFDPALDGYWGSTDLDVATETVVSLIEANRSKIEGIKISLLDAEREMALRARLPDGVVMYTGDDFNYAALMEGDGERHSHGLLGIYDAIAPAAASAFERLAEGDLEGYRGILAPTIALSRRIFEAPTQFYKAGIVFLAWLNGHQTHFRMPGGMEAARGIVHYADVFRLADRAGLLVDPDLAALRMRALCAVSGLG